MQHVVTFIDGRAKFRYCTCMKKIKKKKKKNNNNNNNNNIKYHLPTSFCLKTDCILCCKLESHVHVAFTWKY